MNFKTILSKETTNKIPQIAHQIADWLNQHPEHQVYMIVPDHIKFTAELEMIQQVGELLHPGETAHAVTRFQVYSFKRLAWYLLRDHAVLQRPSLSPVGESMLLQKILATHQEEFVLFRQESRHKGFIERLAAVMHEFHQGGIEVGDFSRFFDVEKANEVEQRLKEFGLIYHYYETAMSRDFVHSDALLEELAATIRELDLSKTMVIVDQAYTLSSRELEVMEALSHAAASVDFHVTMTPYGLKDEARDSGDLFRSNRALVRRLFAWLFVDDAVIHEWSGVDEQYAEDFRMLEQFWLATSGGVQEGSVSSEKQALEHLHWTTYETEAEEMEETLAQIKSLVDSGKYRYQDIQLLSRNLESQQAFLQPMLAQYEIPAFLDLSDTMEHHPLIQVLDSIFAIHQNYWRYHDLMSLLRSEYVFWPNAEVEDDKALEDFRKQLDTTENIILSQGYEGWDWVGRKSWDYREEALDEESVDEERTLTQEEKQLQLAQQLRNQVVSVLEPFYQRMENVENTQEAITEIYQILETLGVTHAFLYWRDTAAASGDVEMARRQEQVWNEFIRLLEEYVYIFGADTFDWEIFQLVLHTGFEHTHYHLAPSTLDQLTVTGLDAVRFSPKKVTFVIGLAQGVLPRMAEESGLLTDEERELLATQLDSGRFLNPTTRMRQSVEPYLFYKVLTSATKELYLSVSNAVDGVAQQPSQYMDRLLRQFTVKQVDGTKRRAERFDRAGFVTPYELFTVLLQRMRQFKHHPEIPSIWVALPHLIRQDSDYQKLYHSLVQSVFRLNQARPLTPELASQLYGNQLYLSTSQVETYYRDPFSHFLQYGLRLKERREFELTAAGAGEYFHEAFDQFIKFIQERQLSIQDIDLETLEKMLAEIFGKMTTDARFTILQSSPRMQFIQELLQDTLKKTLQAAVMQLKALQLKPWRTEVQFGTQTQLPIEIPLNDTQKLLLRGKIDRIDLLETPTHLTMGIVDYKSGDKDFNINQLEAGVQLQLLTYMMIAKQMVEMEKDLPVIPYAGLYMHVQQPNFKATEIKTMAEWQLKWLGKYRLKGLLTNDRGLLSQVEPDFESGSSLYLPYGVKKDGSYTVASRVLEMDDLEFLMEFAFLKLRQAGERILQGDTLLAPYDEDKAFADSVTGKFASISQFDATNWENQYRSYNHYSLLEGIEHLKQQLKGETEE